MENVISKRVAVIVAELNAVQASLNETELQALAQHIIKAKNVIFTAQGRSGNMVRALAIRFMHIGINAYVAGEPSTPPIGFGDLLIAVSSSAKTKITLNHLETAKKAGAITAIITTVAQNPGLSELYICLPVRTKISTVQHAGSLFEQSVLVVGDAIASYVQQQLSVTEQEMDQRHANLQ